MEIVNLTCEGVKSFVDSYYKLRGGKERDKEDILLFAASASQLDSTISSSSAELARRVSSCKIPSFV